MRRLLRWLGYGIAGLGAIALLLSAWIWFASSREIVRVHSIAADPLPQPTPAQLADAAVACASCHGPDVGGGKAASEPIEARSRPGSRSGGGAAIMATAACL